MGSVPDLVLLLSPYWTAISRISLSMEPPPPLPGSGFHLAATCSRRAGRPHPSLLSPAQSSYPISLAAICHGKVGGHLVRWVVDEGPFCSLIRNWDFFVFNWRGYMSMILDLGDVGVKMLLKAYSLHDQADVVVRLMP